MKTETSVFKYIWENPRKFRLFRVLFIKKIFDVGFSRLNNLKYGIILFGWLSGDKTQTLFIAVLWIVACFIVGALWHIFRIVDSETELGNLFDPFARDVRESLSCQKKGKV